MKSDKVLLIFTRNPSLGKVKTRLAKSLGATKALAIYQMLLEKTRQVVKNLSCEVKIYYSESVPIKDDWDPQYPKIRQQGSDLGVRMHKAFKENFEQGYRRVVIIGSDLYDLQPEHIEEAFQALEDSDAVLGPAKDGGYYLLGMNQLYPEVFKDKAWGTSTVQSATLQDLAKVQVHLLEELNDIDVIEDIAEHPAFKQFL